METATFGAGCFWGVQSSFDKINGVIKTTVGYMGGSIKNPTYEQVSTGHTGHVEVINIIYDPKIVTYNDLLNLFWNIHDPTQYNMQGLDIGTQYKSIIFYHNNKQKKIAEESKKRLNDSKFYNKDIVTEIKPAQDFFPAEEYHQKYLEKIGYQS